MYVISQHTHEHVYALEIGICYLNVPSKESAEKIENWSVCEVNYQVFGCMAVMFQVFCSVLFS